MRRRELIIGGSTAAAGLVAATQRPWLAQLLQAQADSALTARFIRPQDQLSITFRFFNLKLIALGAPGPGPRNKARLVPVDSRFAPIIVAEFAPQAIVERALLEGDTPAQSEPLAGLPLDARLAGASRLAFRIPANPGFVEFSDAGLLSWAGLAPNLPANADPFDAKPAPAKPSDRVTDIEYPWRLHLAPSSSAAQWRHSVAPVEHEGRTELWHTRLASAPELIEATRPAGSLRAVYSEDFDKNPAKVSSSYKPFRMTLRPSQRSQLVSLTSDFSLYSDPNYSPDVIAARRLMLSSQGAWADLRADLHPDKNKGFSLLHYSSRGTMGREHFAKVVTEGYLVPLGHPAVLITITERKVQTIEGGPGKGRPAAVLRQRNFIVVRKPVQTYASPRMPFTAVRVVTEVTPSLNGFDEGLPLYDEKTRVPTGDPKKAYDSKAFWPRVGRTTSSSISWARTRRASRWPSRHR